MLVVETIAKIRRAYFSLGKPIKGRCQSNDVSSTRSAPHPSASRGLRRKSTPLPQCGRASLFVDFPRDEVPLQIEMIVDLSVD
jgi:hypothetical protein